MLRLMMVLTGAITGVSGMAGAQSFPIKPIRLVASAPGSFTDLAARIVAQGLSARFGGSVIVDDRTGNMVNIDTVVKASPDGHTVLVFGNPVWLARLVHKHLSYDPMKELSPVALMSRIPYMLVVHPSVPAKSVADLVTLAKAKPGGLNYAYGTSADTSRLAGELFKSMTGLNIVAVPYNSAAYALNGVIRGEVQVMFSAGSAIQHVKAGRLLALAVTTAEPSVLMPGLSTVAASGLPGYEMQSTLGAFVPVKTPESVIRRLRVEFMATLNEPGTKQKYLDIGTEAIGGTPAQLAAVAQAETARLGKLISDLGISD